MSQGSDMRSVVLLISICGLVQGLSRVDPLVSTKAGLIRGLKSGDGYAEFLGVPYAVVDENNPFGPSVPHPGFDDIFEAYESNLCPQVNNDVATGTIDCLTMNIYVPSIANSRNPLPVMVWIHGGGFSRGSAESDGSPKFLLRHDVIVVAINYRLGVYGFMCLDIPEVSGNQGLKDQVLALRWINDNIEAFGGNPRQITVLGESAGGISVNLHLLSSYEKLFQRAVIQSGPALTHLWTKEHDNTMPIKLAKELSFNTTDIHEALAYLSTIDALTIIKVANDLNKAPTVQGKNFLTASPCIETKFEGIKNFITEHPRNIVSSKVKSTNVIIGHNNNEFAVSSEFADDEYYRAFSFEDHLSLGFDFYNDLDDATDLIRHFYIGDEETTENVKEELSDFASDLYYGYPTQRVADQLLQNGASSVYRYIFSYSGGRNMMKVTLNMNSTGATHADELGYLFDFEMFSGETTPEDQLIIDRMTTIWTNFAKFGDPTPEKTALIPIKWEPITKTTQPCLDINLDLSLQGRPYQERMVFWDMFYKLYGKYQI